MRVLAVDPGYEESAFVLWDGHIIDHGIVGNEEFLARLRAEVGLHPSCVLAVEKIESMGMAVGRTVFETVFVSGRFAEAWHPLRVDRVSRHEVKLHICGSRKAKDAEIRQALIDRFGPTKEKAIGKTKTPGPLFGIKSHEWAALAVALTWHDQHSGEIRPGITAQF